MKKFWHWLADRQSWRVIYRDGERSRRMKLRFAVGYKEIFGGELLFDPLELKKEK